jgi:uncharacterized protein YukE
MIVMNKICTYLIKVSDAIKEEADKIRNTEQRSRYEQWNKNCSKNSTSEIFRTSLSECERESRDKMAALARLASQLSFVRKICGLEAEAGDSNKPRSNFFSNQTDCASFTSVALSKCLAHVADVANQTAVINKTLAEARCRQQAI